MRAILGSPLNSEGNLSFFGQERKMNGKHYRLTSTSVGIRPIDGRRIPVTLPSNAIVEVAGDPYDGGSLVDVVWEGSIVMMRTQDLRQRGEEVES